MKVCLSLCLSLSLLPPSLRGAGSAAINMCHVAAGSVEAYYETGIHCWDFAASAVIVSEAGGVLMDVEGTATRRHPSLWIKT